MRIGVDRDYALKGIDSGQAAAIEAALRGAAAAWARRIVDVRMPDLSRSGRDVVGDLWLGDRGGARGDLSVARERVRSVHARVPGHGRACHAATAGGGT